MKYYHFFMQSGTILELHEGDRIEDMADFLKRNIEYEGPIVKIEESEEPF